MRATCVSVTHEYRSGTRALTDVALTLEAGVTGLVGVNGAGKSTLLRILAGGMRPTSGEVTVNGTPLYGRARRSLLRSIALMPQELQVPREMTATQVVRYLGWLRGLSGREAVARGRVALAAVGLTDRSSSRVSTLSGGMVRRLALAQALVAEPGLLLLDEPTTGLDPEQRSAVRDLIAGLPRDRVTLISSHLMEDIEHLVDHLVVLDDGQVLYQGRLDALLERQGTTSAEHAFLALLAGNREAS